VRARVESELGPFLATVNSELSGYEQLQMFVIAKEAFSVENGMLTPTMKLKRSAIEARYAGDVEGWYGRRERIVWQ